MKDEDKEKLSRMLNRYGIVGVLQAIEDHFRKDFGLSGSKNSYRKAVLVARVSYLLGGVRRGSDGVAVAVPVPSDFR